MWTKSWLSLVVIVAAGVALEPEKHLEACGMDFPTNLILRRADALATMWEGSFAEEATRLVAVSPRDRLAFDAKHEPVTASAREQALYTAAAERFHAGAFREAGDGFEALLRLPANERRRFSVAAAYSLGRARDATYTTEAAIAAYRQVRALVRAGFYDDQELARSSLGQEAHTERSQRDHDTTAVHLYAEQAALGDPGAVTSLYLVARWTDAHDRAELYRDDVGTSFLALYFYTRGNELDENEHARWKRELARHVTSETRGAAYMAASAYRAGEWDAAAAFAKRCKRAPIATWVKAKLALRDGDRAKAEALLRTVERAGLVGNVDTEIAAYALDYDPHSLVRAELGLLALANARFTEAADWFARGERDLEAAYVLERVMSRDELLAAVQSTREARRAGPPPIEDGTSPDDVCRYWDRPEDAHGYCPARRLLDIYARRLLREHRYDEALDAFADSEASLTPKVTATPHVNAAADEATDDADATEHPVVVAHANAIAFVDAMKRANASSGIERAEHLFRAARTMRERGMEIAGTEVGPDWAMYDGGYQRSMPCVPSPTRGFDRFAERTDDDYDDDWAEDCVRPTRADAALISPLEMQRVRASAPEVDQRFSYRYVASQLAEQAAGLLPPRSQAYATTLCWAAKFARRDRTRVDALYATYVRNGASGIGGSFGESCEEPDFHRARTFDEDQAEQRLQNALAAERQRGWTWPRLRNALWRRRALFAIPIVGLLLLVLAWRLIAARAAHAAKATTRD